MRTTDAEYDDTFLPFRRNSENFQARELWFYTVSKYELETFG